MTLRVKIISAGTVFYHVAIRCEPDRDQKLLTNREYNVTIMRKVISALIHDGSFTY